MCDNACVSHLSVQPPLSISISQASLSSTIVHITPRHLEYAVLAMSGHSLIHTLYDTALTCRDAYLTANNLFQFMILNHIDSNDNGKHSILNFPCTRITWTADDETTNHAHNDTDAQHNKDSGKHLNNSDCKKVSGNAHAKFQNNFICGAASDNQHVDFVNTVNEQSNATKQHCV